MPRTAATPLAKKPVPVTATTVPTHQYLKTSGKGDKTIAAQALPAKWTVTWRFDCTKPTRKAPFQLATTETGQAATPIIKQDGLGGGGQQPFTTAGNYSFNITTTCNWNLTLEATPAK